jgi:hypothetical protein
VVTAATSAQAFQTDRVAHRRPGRAAPLPCGHHRLRPAGPHLSLALTLAERVAKGPVSTVLASGRSYGETSTASTSRPSAALGNGTQF